MTKYVSHSSDAPRKGGWSLQTSLLHRRNTVVRKMCQFLPLVQRFDENPSRDRTKRGQMCQICSKSANLRPWASCAPRLYCARVRSSLVIMRMAAEHTFGKCPPNICYSPSFAVLKARFDLVHYAHDLFYGCFTTFYSQRVPNLASLCLKFPAWKVLQNQRQNGLRPRKLFTKSFHIF